MAVNNWEFLRQEMTTRNIHILIADDHAMFCDALRDLLEREADFHVVGRACDGKEVIRQVAKLKPDLLLLDLSMPGMSGVEAMRAFVENGVKVRTLILAATVDRSQLIEVLRLGARGIVMKDSATPMLFKAIRTVMNGQYWISHDGVADLIDSLRTAPRDNGSETHVKGGVQLSARELEIVEAIVDGCTNKDIAKTFSLSEQTVKHHLTNIFSKIGVSNRLELALFAMHNRLQPWRAMMKPSPSSSAQAQDCA
jgi:two-component system nitrate/nitrite response regulator NarL